MENILVIISSGLTAVAAASITSFIGPTFLERRRARLEEDALWGPTKDILKELLDNAAPGKGRSFKTLKKVTGLPDEQLCRLLIGVGARGFTRPDGEYAWVYKEKRPFKPQRRPMT